ncbi:MAG: rhodanese-related sulfurtransferase [Sphingomonadales bacterium]|nr:rhodanese-related sulfurtransferase [Sphingomonadales bacterium]
MKALHNRISRKELKERMSNDPTPRTTVSFYHYFLITDPSGFRDQLYHLLNSVGVVGRIYVAREGINAQISVPTAQLALFKETLYGIEPLKGIRLNTAVDNNSRSFFVLDIKVRDKIVADGITDPAFDMQRKGRYATPEQFNEMAKDPRTIIIDMRNYYEYEVGHFKDAIEIPSDTFRQQLPLAADLMRDKKDATILMYCTGGIRCEKASAYMLHNGFKNVFHLEGGIINYARQVKEKQLDNLFIGKNFVFDERLSERITDHVIAHCHQCGAPADTHVNCANEGCHLLFIQCESCALTLKGCCTPACLQVASLPAEERKKLRKGVDKGQHIFNKSRSRLPLLSSKEPPGSSGQSV